MEKTYTTSIRLPIDFKKYVNLINFSKICRIAIDVEIKNYDNKMNKLREAGKYSTIVKELKRVIEDDDGRT